MMAFAQRDAPFRHLDKAGITQMKLLCAEPGTLQSYCPELNLVQRCASMCAKPSLVYAPSGIMITSSRSATMPGTKQKDPKRIISSLR